MKAIEGLKKGYNKMKEETTLERWFNKGDK
jgi:hypothetical protein